MSAMPVVWRPRLGRLVPHGLLPVIAGLLAWIGYFMLSEVGPEDIALFALFGLIALVLLYLAGRPRLVAHDRGLIVVNMLRRRDLAWAEVIAARMPEGEPWPTFDLSDGTTLAAMGIQASDGELARRHLEELHVLLDQRSETSDPD